MEKFSKPETINVDPEQETFLIENIEEIEALKSIFQTADYETFLTLPSRLAALKQNFPDEWLGLFIDPTYVEAEESSLRQLSDEDGIYLPADERGGGDFWEKHNRGGAAGQVSTEMEVADIAGHGPEKMLAKALLKRLIELYRQQPAEAQNNLFATIDHFFEQLPIQSNVVEYREVRLVESEKGDTKLEVEGTGTLAVFVRDNATGEVQLLGSGYPPLGVGLIKPDERLIKEVALPAEADIYICSDGLFELPESNEQKQKRDFFGDHFAEFCNQRKALSASDFRHNLLDLVRRAREEQRQKDDITILVLHHETQK